MSHAELEKSPLGKASTYPTEYSASHLFMLERAKFRQEIGISQALPFHGIDIWNAYEFSWLNRKGKPEIAIVEFIIPCESTALIESKSFKLYLNSFMQTKFADQFAVQKALSNDLALAVGAPVVVNLIFPEQFAELEIVEFPGICLDEQDIEITQYTADPSLLTTNNSQVTETVFSNLLKSNCPITGQPDWASVLIHYQGKQINHAGLLRYIVSLRDHQEFHEQCIERIFMEIMQHCHPTKLSVYARYTRRGGLDINPFRSNCEESKWGNWRLARQ